MDKIICIGKNYRDHIAEMRDTPSEKPVLFLKPPCALLNCEEGAKIAFGSENVHHELEIVFKISREAEKATSFTQAFSHFTLGLDLTKRDIQKNLKKNGHPWEIAKVFSASAVIGKWLSINLWPQFSLQNFFLEINQAVRQKGLAKEMILDPFECLLHARTYFPICGGDLLFTGTPSGVGALKVSDQINLKWGGDILGHIVVI